MAEEKNQDLVTVEYVGSGGAASDVAEYREDGSGIVETGDTVDLPKDVAERFVLNADWQYASGAEGPENVDREDPNVGESPVEGLTANDDVSKVPYDEQVRLREEKGDITAPDPDAPTPLDERLAQIRDEENAKAEGQAGDGEPSDREQEEE